MVGKADLAYEGGKSAVKASKKALKKLKLPAAVGALLGSSDESEAAVWGKPIKEIIGAVQDGKQYLYHSGDASVADNIHRFGVEPTNRGEWIEEVASGATDDVDDLLDGSPPAAWFSDKPDWVLTKARRAAQKAGDNALPDDEVIRKYGHVSVIDPEDDWSPPIYHIGDEGLSEGEYSMVTPYGGSPVKLYETDLYDHDMPGKYPFGIEVNEYVSAANVEPVASYTGDDLVSFLDRMKGNADPRLLAGIAGTGTAALAAPTAIDYLTHGMPAPEQNAYAGNPYAGRLADAIDGYTDPFGGLVLDTTGTAKWLRELGQPKTMGQRISNAIGAVPF